MLPETMIRRILARRPGSACTLTAARLAALSTLAITLAEANG